MLQDILYEIHYKIPYDMKYKLKLVHDINMNITQNSKHKYMAQNPSK